jgi:hypothetical protein
VTPYPRIASAKNRLPVILGIVEVPSLVERFAAGRRAAAQ